MPVSSVYFLPGRAGLAAWRRQLQEKLSLHAGAESRAVIRLYDSFDGRLRRAGLQLLAESPHGSREWQLCLRHREDHGVVARMRLQAAPPAMPGELPPGVLRERLCRKLKLRALLPVAELDARRLELERLDAGGKIRARLFLEDFRIRDPATGRSRSLVRWLRLEALRGYEGEADALRVALEGNLSLPPRDGDLLEAVQGMLGSAPERQAFRRAPVINDGLRADHAVRALLGHLLDVIEANESGTLQRLDTEFLHDLRVAVRSLRALLRQLKTVFPPVLLERLSGDFQWLGGITGPARDLDVWLLQFDELKALLPSARQPDLEPLRALLERQREEAHAELARQLRSPRYRGLKRRLHTWLSRPPVARPRAADAHRPIGEVARRRTWRMYRRVLREGRAISGDSPPEALHELRKSCKKLRYLIQFFRDLYDPREVDLAIAELKRLQDNLGAFQDLTVQGRRLAELAPSMRAAGAATLDAMSALREVLEVRTLEARAEFAARFRRFDRKANRRRYRALFHS